MQDTKLIRITLMHYGTTQYKLPNRPGGLFYPLALLRLVCLLYELPNRLDGLSPSGTFTACCTSYQIGQRGFLSLVLLRLAIQATKQARRTSTLWHFYNLLNCETPNRLDRLLLSDTWRLYHLQSAWVGWWSRSRTAFDLHASWFDLQTS